MSDPASSSPPAHLVRVQVEIDEEQYETVIITDDPSIWFANSVGQAVALSIIEHFYGGDDE